MAQINEITLDPKDNIVYFSDNNPATDYCHLYTLGTKETIEWLKKDGAKKITADLCNNELTTTLIKRLNKIAKESGYEIEQFIIARQSPYNGEKWNEIVFELTKRN